MYFVGVDIAKYHHEAAIIDEAGNVIVKKLKFDNSHQGYNKLMKEVRKLSCEAVFAMEATGHYWLALYAHLRADKQTVHVINPIQSDALRGLYIRKTKNDAIDAQIIADVVRFGRYCQTSVAPEDILSLRELCRQRFYIVDTASDFKRKAIALLDQTFPEYGKLFSDTFGKSSLELLSNYTTPEEILAVDSGVLAELLSKASRGRLGIDKAMEVQEKAKNSFGIVMASTSFALILRQLIEQIKSLESSIEAFDKEIARIFSTFDTKLTTITGIGTTLAATIFAEIGGNIKRFSESGKLAAFAGIDPTVKESGEFIGNKNKMSKRGSPYLRRAIWLASTVAAFKDPAIHRFYEKKLSEGKPHLTVIGHICRKMVSIIFAVMRDNKPYVPNLKLA